MKKRLFSGIQPSGQLHLGNYLGAVKQWIALQQEYDSFFSIVDLHAITVRQDPVALKHNIRLAAATFLACGVDPEKATMFVQSHVPQHTELAWALSTFTHMGELSRMTQFKDKAAKLISNTTNLPELLAKVAISPLNNESISAGLFTYPILMAADILLYDTAVVPVGDDQKQHVELTRDIAQRVNNHYKKDIFIVPEGKFMKEGSRIMGLDNPENKMSKSASSELNYISLLDEPDMIRKKIMKAVTDTDGEIRAGEDKPGVTNLLTIYSALSGKTIEALEKEYTGRGYGDFKKDLVEVVVEWITPIQQSIDEYLTDSIELDMILRTGAEKAELIANETIDRVYTAMGLR